MKHSVLIAIAAMATPAGAMPPFTYETPSALTSAGDIDNDGRADAVLVDRASGVIRIARHAADGSLQWLAPTPSGIESPTGMCVGRFGGTDSGEQIAITSPSANRATLFALNGSGIDLAARHASPSNPSPHGIAPFDSLGEGVADDLMFIGQADNGGMLGPVPVYYEEVVTGLDAAPYGNGAVTSNTRTHRVFPFIGKAGTPPRGALTRGGEFQMAAVGESGFHPPVTLAGFAASGSTLMTWGNFDGTAYAQVLLYEPNQTAVKGVKVIQPTPGTLGWGTLATLTFPKPVQLLVTIPLAAGGRLAVLFTDGTAAVFDYSGTGAPVKRSDLPSSGYDWLLPLGIDTLFTGRGGVSERWNTSSSAATLAPEWSGTMPVVRSSSRVSNVIFASGEPFVAVDAALVNLVHALDWTLAAAGNGSTWTVTGLNHGTNGLESNVSVPCQPSPGAPFALVNQYRPNISVSLLGPSVGPPTGDVVFSPAPGILPALQASQEPGSPAETCVIRMTPTRPGDSILYRILPAGAWLKYSVSDPPAISGDTTFDAYAILPGTSSMGATRQATYTFAAAGGLGIDPGTDSDGDGLPDEWEKTFNATDPDADADGDGRDNRREFLDRTDPRDGSSFLMPGPLALSSTRIGPPGSEALLLEWSSDHPAAILESSEDLQTWHPVTTGIETTTTGFRYHAPLSPPAPLKSFFRLREP